MYLLSGASLKISIAELKINEKVLIVSSKKKVLFCLEYNPGPVYQTISTGNTGQYNPVQQTAQIVPVEQYTLAQPEYTIVQPVVTVQNTPVQTVHVVQPVQPSVQYTPVQPSASAEYTEVQQVMNTYFFLHF